MGFTETFNETKILIEARNFNQLEIESIRDYVIDNGGHYHKVINKPTIKLSFNQGIARKIQINKSDSMYTITIGPKRRGFKDFSSVVDYLRNET